MVFDPPPRPTSHEARVAASFAVDSTARLLDAQPRVGRCVPKGIKSRVCRVVVSGPQDVTLRVIVTRKPNGDFEVRARITA